MKTFKEFMEAKQLPGTYAATKPDGATARHFIRVMEKYGVPNIEDEEKLHCTLLYSRKHLPDYIPNPYLEHNARATHLEVWPTKSGANCLVLKIYSPEQEHRHEQLMFLHDAEYDYPEYKTHISLSYDIGDYDHTQLPIAELKIPFKLTSEYHEPLDTTGK